MGLQSKPPVHNCEILNSTNEKNFGGHMLPFVIRINHPTSQQVIFQLLGFRQTLVRKKELYQRTILKDKKMSFCQLST